jgi:hypothetical protein
MVDAGSTAKSLQCLVFYGIIDALRNLELIWMRVWLPDRQSLNEYPYFSAMGHRRNRPLPTNEGFSEFVARTFELGSFP